MKYFKHQLNLNYLLDNNGKWFPNNQNRFSPNHLSMQESFSILLNEIGVCLSRIFWLLSNSHQKHTDLHILLPTLSVQMVQINAKHKSVSLDNVFFTKARRPQIFTSRWGMVSSSQGKLGKYSSNKMVPARVPVNVEISIVANSNGRRLKMMSFQTMCWLFDWVEKQVSPGRPGPM